MQRVALIGVACALLAACSPNFLEHDLRTVSIAVYKEDASALLYFAEEKGYFAAEGLEVNFQEKNASQETMDALVERKADMATAGTFSFVRQSFATPTLRTIGTAASFALSELMVRSASGIRTPADLQDHTIGITEGTASALLLDRYLLLNGIPPEAVTEVSLRDPREIVQQLREEKIDAGVVWHPYVFHYQRSASGTIQTWPMEESTRNHFLLVTTENWLVGNRDTTERLLRALLRAERDIRLDRTMMDDFLAEHFGYEAGYVDVLRSRIDFGVSLPQTLIVDMEGAARWMMDHGIVPSQNLPNYLRLVEPGPLERLQPEAVTIIQ